MKKRRLPVVRRSSTYDVLPPLYAGWLDALLGAPIPPEREATCSDCAMVSREGNGIDGGAFDPRTKCCTFLPALPNYLVGGVLSDSDKSSAAAFGRRTVRERIAAGAGVTPAGLMRTKRFSVLYQSTLKTEAFGRALSLRCPHYVEDGGLCGLWKYRESTCATWFCKHEQGNVGHGLWRAVQQLLGGVERALTRHALLTLDVGTEALAALYPLDNALESAAQLEAADVDGRAEPERQQELWGAWSGREEVFYRECARLVEGLTWDRIAAIGGVELSVYARLVRRAHARTLDRALPQRLSAARYEVVASSAETTRVSTYSKLDPLDVPRELLASLHRFDGGPTRRTLRTIAREDGLELDEELVRRLADFGLLEEPS